MRVLSSPGCQTERDTGAKKVENDVAKVCPFADLGAAFRTLAVAAGNALEESPFMSVLTNTEVSLLDRAVRILHLEDDPADRDLIQDLLNREGFALDITHAASRAEFTRALQQESFDIILSDYSVPAIDGLEALHLAKQLRPEVPFVYVSGSMGEEAAADSIKFGATDYVLKHRLDRLKLAVERSLREAEQVRQSRRATEALRQSEERFQLITRASNEVIWDWDIETGACWVSPGIRHFGYSETASPGQRPWLDHIHPNHVERVLNGLERVLAGQDQTWSDEYPFAHHDGALAHVFNRGCVIRDARGRALRMVGAMMDITQRKLAEKLASERTYLAALRAETATALTASVDIEQGLKRICQLAADELHLDWARIWTLDNTGRSLVLQAAAGPMAHIQGFQETVAIAESDIGQIASQGQPCWSDDFAQSARGLERELAQREGLAGFAGYPLLAGGQSIGVIAVYSKKPLAEFAREALPVVAREISLGLEHRRAQDKIRAQEVEKVKLEAQFLRAQRMESIGALASGIAHDLNNVLSPILIGTHFLKEQVHDPSRLKILNAMESSAVRGAEIVKQVLTFARGAGGGQQILQPNQLISEMAAMTRETFPKSIQIKTQCEPKLWNIQADATQIHQVLLNLCVNARDAMLNAGTLTLSSKNVLLQDPVSEAGLSGPSGNYVQITVADTGIGMTPEIQSKIFQPFFTTKGPSIGTGLGLCTTVRILQNHGGLMAVQSQLGRGTAFSVFLPAIITARHSHAVARPPAVPSGRQELILVVDDEVAIREMCKVVLENFEYRVIAAENGAEALALLDRHKDQVAAVVLDMMMPVMGGAAVVRAMRWSAPNVKIIATSGMSEREQASALGDAVADGFVQKPFTAERLACALAAVLVAAPPRTAPAA